MHGGIHQEKVACKANTFDWVWVGVVGPAKLVQVSQGSLWVVLVAYPGKNNSELKVSKFLNKL